LEEPPPQRAKAKRGQAVSDKRFFTVPLYHNRKKLFDEKFFVKKQQIKSLLFPPNAAKKT